MVSGFGSAFKRLGLEILALGCSTTDDSGSGLGTSFSIIFTFLVTLTGCSIFSSTTALVSTGMGLVSTGTGLGSGFGSSTTGGGATGVLGVCETLRDGGSIREKFKCGYNF